MAIGRHFLSDIPYKPGITHHFANDSLICPTVKDEKTSDSMQFLHSLKSTLYCSTVLTCEQQLGHRKHMLDQHHDIMQRRSSKITVSCPSACHNALQIQCRQKSRANAEPATGQ